MTLAQEDNRSWLSTDDSEMLVVPKGRVTGPNPGKMSRQVLVMLLFLPQMTTELSLVPRTSLISFSREFEVKSNV